MAPGVHVAQLADRNFGVDRSRVQACVPEQLLDEADIRAVFEHVRRARVAQQLTRPGPLDAGGARRAKTRAVAVTSQKHRLFSRTCFPARTAFG